MPTRPSPSSNLADRQPSIWTDPDRDAPVFAAFDVTGDLDPARLTDALNPVAGGQQALRTYFREIEGRPVRLLARTARIEADQVDLRGVSATRRAGELSRLLAADAGRHLAVGAAPLCRAVWYRVGDRYHVLSLALHRLVADGCPPARLLAEAVDRYPAPGSGTPVVTERRSPVVEQWAAGPHRELPEFPVSELIAHRATADPTAVALSYGDRHLTYRELDERANRLAHELVAGGVRTETVVAVYLRRGFALPVTLLAILKAGGTYLPLDPAHPPARQSYLLRDSQARVMVTEQAMAPRALAFSGTTLLLDRDADRIAAHPVSPPPVSVPLTSAAYILYTSGSTGVPKGVMVSHLALLNYVCWAREQYRPNQGGGTPLHSPITFDLTVTSLYPALVGGGTVTLVDEAGPGIAPLAAALRQGGSSLVKLTPAHLELLAASLTGPELARATDRLIVGGAALSGSVVQRWARSAPDTVVVNEYGPTEATVGCCTYQIAAGDAPAGPVPVGRPIQNTRSYVLDESLRPCPVGAAGELFVGGLGLARGYLAQPALTAAGFLPDPYADRPGARMYRTGDLVRYSPDGDLQYLGRRDRQVKIRGYRVELGEIEAGLTQHPLVTAAAVVTDQGPDGDVRLVAYPVLERPTDTTDLIEHLRRRLPDYLVPHEFIPVPELPLTGNGKVDLAALPTPPREAAPRRTEAALTAEALTAEVATQVAEVLGVDRLAPQDDFFALGGHSLLMARLIGRLSQRYQLDLPVEPFFLDPSVTGIVRLIRVFHREGRTAAIAAAERPDLDAEARLAEEVNPANLPVAAIRNPSRILLTGATGFLGAFILHELLRSTAAQLHCLVRAADEEAARKRLEQALRTYQIWDGDFAARLVPEVGDLERPLLGLPSTRFAELGESIDTIYHAGANVNFVYPYRVLKRANVDATREVLRLACHTRAKALHHLSAVDVFVRGEDRLIREDEKLQAGNLAGGYIQSKWVAEKLVGTCRDRGLPVKIYRPWVTLGHSTTGVSHLTDYTCLVVKGCLQLGAAPGHDAIVNFMPVDYVSAAIVRLSLQAGSFGDYYHFSNHRAAPLPQVWEWVREYGYPLEIVSYQEWRRRLRHIDADNALFPVSPLLTGEHARDPDRHPEETRPRIDTTNTDAGLAGTGIECPPVSRELCWRILDHLVAARFLPAPDRPRPMTTGHDR